MSKYYVSEKTAYLYEEPTGLKRAMVLIFGDEVEATGSAMNGRLPVTFRKKKGFIKEEALGNQPALELYFIDVGQGDSTFVVTPGGKTILIDGGINRRAMGFLAWKYRLDDPKNTVDVDLLVLSHADGDHIEGLTPIISHPQINVRRVIHSGIATFRSGAYKTSLGDTKKAGERKYLVTRHSKLEDLDVAKLSPSYAAWRYALISEPAGPECAAVDSSMASINLGDSKVTLGILGPRLESLNGEKAYRWFEDEAHTINGHSVVLSLRYKNVTVLFGGDINRKGSENLLEDPAIRSKLSAHVFKAPHHGSHDFTPEFLDAVRPQISVISSGDDPDHGHPRASFIGGVGKASRSDEPLVFSTEIAATFVEAGDVDNSIVTDSGAEARRLFKRRLHGMINVRTDGEKLYSARRVAAGYWWESYEKRAVD
ncbi:MAG: MBL fold metallo-hydrolase [Acidobacteriota bacterium]